MKIVILEANSLGADVDLSAFEKLGEVAVYGQSNMQDTQGENKRRRYYCGKQSADE